MNKIIIRLVAVGMSLALSVTLVLMTTYAWFALSTSPTVSGIQMTMGDNTILVAPDMTVTKDGVTYHYPGEFADTLNFSIHESYSYLNNLGGLIPVTTADGLNWFMPPGSDDSPESLVQVNLSNQTVGSFKLDNTLEQANLTKEELENNSQGHYVYLDFWVVAPTGDYYLRVSSGEDSGGSFLVDLPEAVEAEDGSYTLQGPESGIAAIARVGFLVNKQTLSDDNMLLYIESPDYEDHYKSLRGNYSNTTSGTYSFTIYEPNGDYHPGNLSMNGGYAVTKPLGFDENGKVVPMMVNTITTMQRYSSWVLGTGGQENRISQDFRAFVVNKNFSDLSTQEITEAFYSSFQGQISQYITKGEFIRRSSNLSTDLTKDLLDSLDGDGYDGASEDVIIIKLERNVPQRIRMFIWLEGQDVDLADKAGISNFALNIELAGGSE